MLEPKTFTLNDIKKGSRIYFIGIGGISMNGLARLAKHAGFVVGGSDNHPSERTAILEDQGIKVYYPQVEANIDDFKPDYLVKTAAILPHNEEVKRATELDLQIFDRAEFLGAFTRTYKNVINVSGTHGKTTTTSMISMMMIDQGLDPTVHLGADLDVFNGTVRAGSHDLLVSEACEFNRSFLNFSSTTAVITNIDHDHVDCYPTIEDVIDVFAKFIRLVDDDGYVVVSGHDINIARSLAEAKEYFDKTGRTFPQVVTCATDNEICETTGKKADFIAENIKFNNGVEIPQFGLGVFRSEVGEETANAVEWALEAGYRHIDTATAYRNEADVATGIKRSGVKREDIWITTKCATRAIQAKEAKDCFERSLDLLETDYIDLYLLHWPVPNYVDAYEVITRLYEEKKIRAIGVSNFQIRHLQALERLGLPTPAANQIELHPAFQN